MFKFFSRIGRPVAVQTLVFLLSGFAPLESFFAPKAELWQRWTANDPNSSIVVDHGIWDRFLKTYVVTDDSGLNRVAYGKVTEADKKTLHTYLGDLRSIPVRRLRRAEQQAYWINLYNALTVRLILDFYPVKSIQDIDLGPGLFSSGPWEKKLIKIDGDLVSLNDIEHRILRPIWKDPRHHYAVNCASVSCPNLQRTAFRGATTDAMLDRAATAYINNPRGVRFDGGRLVVSKIYIWFQEDFGGSEETVLNHLRKYADQKLATKLHEISAIADYEYDWGLNE